MPRILLFAVAVAFAALPGEAWAQKRNRARDESFLLAKPAVGDALPELTVYRSDGKAFETAELRGHYAVLVFGCLT